MNLLRRLLQEEDGQGLVEYTLVVVLVALVFWVAVKQSDVGLYLQKSWGRVVQCVATPLVCSA
jgi:Flp pilus assembly pilin Flp